MASTGMDVFTPSWMSRLWAEAAQQAPVRAGRVLRFPNGHGPGTAAAGPVARDDRRHLDQEVALDRDGVELTVRFEPDEGVLWCYQKHAERPCFTPGLLREIQDLQHGLRRRYRAAAVDPADRAATAAAVDRRREVPLRYLVWASARPGVFNLGGDLDLFARLIRARDVDGLRAYARACVDVCYLNATNLGLPLITVHLVQGDALGGGFESVLSSDVIVAEEGTQFGLPEVLFGMFPGMGAYSFLSRRVGQVQAERMILGGKCYPAEELAELGVVDVLAPRGGGEAAVRTFVAENRRRHAMRAALGEVRRRCNPITYEELLDVTEIWVETALALDEADLRRMDRLVTAQRRRGARGEARTA